jgi:hypothetical protein
MSDERHTCETRLLLSNLAGSTICWDSTRVSNSADVKSTTTSLKHIHPTKNPRKSVVVFSLFRNHQHLSSSLLHIGYPCCIFSYSLLFIETMKTQTIVLSVICASTASAFVVKAPSNTHGRTLAAPLGATIISPFDNAASGGDGDDDVATATANPVDVDEGPLDLTWDNVDFVLEGMRPFLIQDGGNVAISEIDGPVVKLELIVRCSNTEDGRTK